MISISEFSFWFYFVYFWLAVILAFTIPGQVILAKLKLSIFQKIILGTIVGMVLWGWQGFLLGYLGVRWASYAYLVIFLLIWLKSVYRRKLFSIRLGIKKIDFLLTLIVLSGMVVQLSSVWFNGILFDKGLFFCCAHVPDIFLHLALTNELVKHFPPFEPGMYGTYVQNYHYWGNLVISELIRVFNLPLIPIQYQYSTVFLSLFLGFTAIVFGQLINLEKSFIKWLTFFLYFGGDLVFLLLLILGKGMDFGMSSMEDGAKFLANPPRAFAVVVFFAGLSLFYLWLKRKNLKSGILMALLFGTAIGFKVYIGIFALTGLAALSFYFLLKKDFKMLLPVILTILISAIVYFPVNSNAGGLFYTGLWRFEDFIVQPKLGLQRLELARRIFYDHQNWIRVAIQESIYISLFTFSIFGSKLFGIFQSKKSISKFPAELNVLLITGIIVSLIGGSFFQQRTGGANTFNFLVNIFIIGSIYTALSCSFWISKVNNKIKIFAVLIIILLTVPRVLNQTYFNFKLIYLKDSNTIENKEIQALDFIKNETAKDSLILVDYRSFVSDAESPYISFMTNRSSYLSGMGNELNAHGIDYSDRQKNVDYILKKSDPLLVKNLLLINQIDYIIMSNTYNLESTYSANFLKPVFKNEKFKILEFSENMAREYFKNDYKTLQK